MIEKVKKIVKSNKKETLISIVALLFIIMAVVGITYAAFSYTKAGTKSNKVTTSTITMNYNEATNGITLTNAFPISDNDGKQLTGEGNTFGFTVTVTTGNNTPVGYEISAVKDPNSTLENGDVRIYLEKSTSGAEGTYSSVLEPTGFNPINATTEIGTPAGEMLLHSDSTTSTRTDYYILRMWVAEDYIVTGESKFFTIKVNVYGTDSSISSSGISLNKNTLTLDEGQSEKLIATVTPDYATDKSVTWESSNTSVAVVDSNGNVTAQSLPGTSGIANITAHDANGHVATCVVTVEKPVPNGVEVVGNTTELNLITGGSTTLEANTTPSNARDNDITWTSSDSSVVDIEQYTEANASGTGNSKSVSANKVRVTAVGTGDATLTVKSASNSSATPTVINVSILDPEVEGITLDQDSITIDRGSTTSISASITPSNSRDKKVRWSSSNSSVASLTCTGGSTNSSGEIETNSTTSTCTVNAISKGTSEVTVIDAKGHSDTAIITVRSSEAVSLSMPVSTNVTRLSSTIFEVSGLTSDNENDPRNMEDVTVTSSNINVVANPSCTYNSSTHKLGCEVSGLTTGSSTITASVGSISTTMSLTVNPINVSSITVKDPDNETSGTIKDDETLQLSATVLPANADDTSVTWSSSDTSVATVNQSGLVSAVAEGNVTIYATSTADNTIRGSYSIEVKSDPYALIPVMTSNTEPYGTAIGSYYEDHIPYKAFDNDESTNWYDDAGCTGYSGDFVLEYDFGMDVNIHYVKMVVGPNTGPLYNYYLTIQYWNGTSYVNYYSTVTPLGSSIPIARIETTPINSVHTSKIRLLSRNDTNSRCRGAATVYTLQAYGYN